MAVSERAASTNDPPRSALCRAASKDCSADRNWPYDDQGADADKLSATLQMYHIGQQGNGCNAQSHTSSVLSKSQQIAENLFGVQTVYTLRHCVPKKGKAHDVTISDCRSTPDQRGNFCSNRENGILVDGLNVSADTTAKTRPHVPNFCLDLTHISHERPQSARFLSISRPGLSRINVRLTELACRPASSRFHPPRPASARMHTPRTLQTPTLRMDFEELEKSWTKAPRGQVHMTSKHAGCRYLSQGVTESKLVAFARNQTSNRCIGTKIDLHPCTEGQASHLKNVQVSPRECSSPTPALVQINDERIPPNRLQQGNVHENGAEDNDLVTSLPSNFHNTPVFVFNNHIDTLAWCILHSICIAKSKYALNFKENDCHCWSLKTN